MSAQHVPLLDEPLRQHVGQALEHLFRARRVTQAQVARESGVSSQQVNRYVNAHNLPDLDTLHRLIAGAGADWYEWAQAWDEADGKEPARLVRVALEPPPPMPPIAGEQKLRAAAEALRLAAEALSRAVD